MILGVSVIICTYNGVARLPETLRYISQQQVHASIPWEVIVVDNASTDHTSEVVCQEWAKYQSNIPFSLYQQPKPGLTFARELALEKAKYEFIIFCDDDNWLNPGYVELAYNIMLEHPSVGALGGFGELVYEIEPPAWAAALPLFANGKQANVSGKVPRNAVYGAGCVVRKSAYNGVIEAGFRPMLSDRVAANLSSGGDYELCYALVLAGYDIWYDERLLFKHFMPKDRLQWEYYLRFFKERAKCFEVLVPYQLIINYGCISDKSFTNKYFSLFMKFAKQTYPLLLNKMRFSPNSDKGKITTLKLKALQLRLSSFGKFKTMKENHGTILKMKQEKLDGLSKSITLQPHQ
ncbi:glycosyltransferase [Pontibacter arcticus]|uniref:Glycosyltransferase 2-like domain-containing protein n=1 Tax=Pontibacter arcticus TaxID=2080288 RepID=A0A364RDK1_9BACT|nr:glycosyltransferase [Pontibacter arcticus]RAU82363.1 hypothetical protein DP923_11295 [Pontibacter arcticus]